MLERDVVIVVEPPHRIKPPCVPKRSQFVLSAETSMIIEPFCVHAHASQTIVTSVRLTGAPRSPVHTPPLLVAWRVLMLPSIALFAPRFDSGVLVCEAEEKALHGKQAALARISHMDHHR